MECAATLPGAGKPLRLRFAWLAPFAKLQPLAISPDDLHARDRMRLIAEASNVDCARALAKATTEARDWVSEGRASLEQAWLQPIIAEEGEEGALFAIHGQYGIEYYSLELAYKSEEFRERLNVLVPVRRAWGVPGLMWALLLDRLGRAQPYWTCERCRKLISGKRDKRFCSGEDDPECYQARKTEDKRRSRSRGSTRR
jgi:hypothetical protein